MGTTIFADRGTLLINAKPAMNVKSIKLTIDESVAVVDTMTANHRSSGYRKGNRKVSGSFEVELENQKAALDLSFQYGNDISVVFQVGEGSERWQILGLAQTNQDLNTGVGEAGKSISFVALDAINENGTAVNADVGL